MSMRFDGRVAIVTGAGGGNGGIGYGIPTHNLGLGKAYALLLAQRGASVVVNDLGGSRTGQGASTSAADLVVQEIIRSGGKAVPNYDSVEQGHKIVETALRHFGRVDILINNAGILRDRSFAKMSDEEWDSICQVHLYGSYKVTKAAWDHFQKQGYGRYHGQLVCLVPDSFNRIVMTSSAAGLYGNYGQANYASAKHALVGFGLTLAKEGVKKNIKCNIVAPVAGSRITETVLPPDLIDRLKPDYVAPFVAFLCHETCPDNGSVYEVGSGWAGRVRWERSEGLLFKVDDSTFTPSAIKAKQKELDSFTKPAYPQSMSEVDWVGLLERSRGLPSNPQQNPRLRFDNRVVLVTGAGGGLGRAYALMFGSLGATVIVNDLGTSGNGSRLADQVVKEIISSGGKATADYHSVEQGDQIVENIIARHGRLDVLVNNAGVLRDRSFTKMTDQEWSLVVAIHLRGTYKVTKAAWPHMLRQGYGRIINTSSAVGLYGNFGQANYSAAKAGILGLGASLALEGEKNNVLVNTIAPNAGTQMTATILSKDVVQILKPDYVAPLVGYLAHESCQHKGAIFEVGSGWVARVRRQRSAGYRIVQPVTLEAVVEHWPKFTDFSHSPVYPRNAQESFSSIVAQISSEFPKPTLASEEFTFTQRDVILYNLGIGCAEKDLKYVYEGAADFAAIPTFAIIPGFILMMKTKMEDYVTGYSPVLLLHGEHYTELLRTLPASGKLRSEQQVLQVQDKGKAGAIVVIQQKTFDCQTNELLAINEGTIFLRGAKARTPINKEGERRPLAVLAPTMPERPPDKVQTQAIPKNQAAIYRLSGDYNPLHIDPDFARMANFPGPILHGLCTYGHAAQHIIKSFANNEPTRLKAIKARFTKHVFPGETIQTEMWAVSGSRILFQVRVVERNEIVISSAVAELQPTSIPPRIPPSGEAPATTREIFQQFARNFRSLPNTVRQDLINQVNGSFQFVIGQDGDCYQIDLKAGGNIGPGRIEKPDVTLSTSEADFVALALGKLEGQQAFMKGRLKVKGNMMLAMKLDRVLKALSNRLTNKL